MLLQVVYVVLQILDEMTKPQYRRLVVIGGLSHTGLTTVFPHMLQESIEANRSWSLAGRGVGVGPR